MTRELLPNYKSDLCPTLCLIGAQKMQEWYYCFILLYSHLNNSNTFVFFPNLNIYYLPYYRYELSTILLLCTVVMYYVDRIIDKRGHIPALNILSSYHPSYYPSYSIILFSFFSQGGGVHINQSSIVFLSNAPAAKTPCTGGAYKHLSVILYFIMIAINRILFFLFSSPSLFPS